MKRPVVHQPRPDANSHFDIVDDGPASAGKTQRPQRASGTSKQRSGLYSETVFGDDHGGGSGDARPTSASSSGSAQPGQARNSCSTAGHQRNFGSQFEMTDDSPVPPKRFTEASQPSSRPGGDKQNSAGPYHAGPDRAAANGGTVGQRKVLQGLNANWQMHDDSPESGAGLKENQPIHAAGPKAFDDGAGQKKANALNWSIGGPDGDADADADAARLPDRSKAAEPLQRRNRNESQLSGDFWEF